MKRNVSTLAALVVILSCFVDSTAIATPQINLYVATHGNDNNPGTESKPFATLEGARLAIRQMRNSQKDTDITIYFKEGRYRLDDTVILGPEDGGTEKTTVTYAATPGQKVSLCGGKPILGWQHHNKNIWKANVNFPFRQLYVNGHRAVRARIPNGENNFLRIKRWDNKARRIIVNTSEVSNWENFDNIEMVVQYNWAESYFRLHSFNVDGDEASLEIQSPEIDIAFERPYPLRSSGLAYHFENAYEFLDEPGEWYLDTNDNCLYLTPFDSNDSTITSNHFVAPKIETLVKVQGTLDNPVKNLIFQGFIFEHTTWMRPSELGVLNMQGGMYNIKADKHNNQFVERPPAAVYVAIAENVTFKKNIFRHLGACAIDFHYGTKECKITGNVIHDISGNGIQHARVNAYEGAESHETYNPKEKRELSLNDTISNNYIARIGRDYFGSHAIFSGWPVGVRIEHNEIIETPYSAISVGWGWTDNQNAMRDNKIRYNLIQKSQQLLGDSGAIYTLSLQPGSEIAFNYIKDVHQSPWTIAHVSGIYLDERSDGFKIHHNMLTNVDMHPYFLHNVGEDVVFHNNAFRWNKLNEFRGGKDFYQEIIQKAGLEPEYKIIKEYLKTNNSK